jgi:hypothetical protein
MRRSTLALLALACLLQPTAAQFKPLKPLDLKEADPALAEDIFGPWEIRDKNGKKRCRIVLRKETTAGSFAIDIPESCGKTFPVLREIGGWRLLESWTIDLVDANWRTRVRFSTPDDNYVAIPEVDGIDRLVKPAGKK